MKPAKDDSEDWFNFQDLRTRPKPSHQRPAPSAGKVKEMGLTDRVAEIGRPSRDDGIEVQELTSDSMIMRVLGKIPNPFR